MDYLRKTPAKNIVILLVRLFLASTVNYGLSQVFFTARLLQLAALVESYVHEFFPAITDSETAKLRKMHSLYPPIEHPLPVLLYCCGVYGFLYVSSKNAKLSKKFLQATMLAIGSAAWTLTSQRIAEMHFAIILANCLFSIAANLVIAFFMFVGKNKAE